MWKGELDMPFVNIQLLEGRTIEQKGKIAEAITKVMVEIGGAKSDAVFVIFNDIEKSNLAKGGILVSNQSNR